MKTKMKLMMLLVLIMLLSVVGCIEDDGDDSNGGNTGVINVQVDDANWSEGQDLEDFLGDNNE